MESKNPSKSETKGGQQNKNKGGQQKNPRLVSKKKATAKKTNLNSKKNQR